jgi:sterol desaturase/sphingolipid hydroxylase (fatty acid hydroxylase superfamily)
VNHHSAKEFNFSVGFRQTWTPFFAFIFWLPLPLIGFDPLMVIIMQMMSLFFQAMLHTQFIGSLGILGWVFNTPGHHQVHHGVNQAYLDKNFGGVLIIWDRLFGTFAQKKEEIIYGIEPQLETINPFKVAFHEWFALFIGRKK